MFSKLFLLLSLLSLIAFASDTMDTTLITELNAGLFTTDKPVDLAWLKSRGGNVQTVLISMYGRDHKVRHRIKLLEALGNFNDTATVAFLKDRNVSTENRVLRLVAIRSLGQGMGRDSIEVLKGSLQDNDPHVRRQTAETLADLKTPESDALVQGFLAQEKADWVTSRVKKHLALSEPPQPGIVHLKR